jgi:hypothetical protein
MRNISGIKPNYWSDSFWRSVVWPKMKTPISAEVILDNLIKNKVNLILVGGYASVYHGLSENTDRKDYDFIINNEEKNLNLMFEILSENYDVNKQVFLSNILNYLKLETTSKGIDFIKKLSWIRKLNRSLPNNNDPKKYTKELNYSILIKNSKKINLNGNTIDVMGLQDYIDSQHSEPFVEGEKN